MAKATKPSPQMLRQIREFSEEKTPESENKQSFTQEVNQDDLVEKVDQEQMKTNDEAWAKKRIEEIEGEIKILTQKRQEERRKRRESSFAKASEDKEKMAQEKAVVPEISSKPKRGLFWGKRIKTAQQQAQPETAGRRVGG